MGEFDKQILSEYNNVHGTNYQTIDTELMMELCGSSFPYCIRRDIIKYAFAGDFFDATGSTTGSAAYSFDSVFGVSNFFEGTLNLFYGECNNQIQNYKYSTGSVNSTSVVQYACKLFANSECVLWTKV